MLHRMGILLVMTGLGAVGWTVWRTQSESVGTYGVVQAKPVHVASLEAGRIAEVLVQEGQSVHAGQVLARIDPFTLLEELAAAEAELSAAQAAFASMQAGRPAPMLAQATARRDRCAALLAGLRNGPRTEEIEIARLAVQRAQAEQTYADANLDRLTRLQKMARASQTELEEASVDAINARSHADTARHSLALLVAGAPTDKIAAAEAALAEATAALELQQAGYAAAELAAADARVATAAAHVASIHKRLNELELKSPCDCVIETITAGPGTLVDAKQRWAVLRDPSRLHVETDLNIRELSDARPGEPIALRLRSRPTAELAGHIVHIDRIPSAAEGGYLRLGRPSTHTAVVRIALDDHASPIKPGAVVEMRFRTQEASPAGVVEPEPSPLVASGHQGDIN